MEDPVSLQMQVPLSNQLLVIGRSSAVPESHAVVASRGLEGYADFLRWYHKYQSRGPTARYDWWTTDRIASIVRHRQLNVMLNQSLRGKICRQLLLPAGQDNEQVALSRSISSRVMQAPPTFPDAKILVSSPLRYGQTRDVYWMALINIAAQIGQLI